MIADAGHAQFATVKDRRAYIEQGLMMGEPIRPLADYLGLKLETARRDLRADTAMRYKVIAYRYGQGDHPDTIAANLMMRKKPIEELIGRMLAKIGEPSSPEREAIREKRAYAQARRAQAAPVNVVKLDATPSASRGFDGDPCGAGPSNVTSLAAHRERIRKP